MPLQLSDGKGRGYTAAVNAQNELVVRAIVEPEVEHASSSLGSAYSWVSAATDIDTGDTRLFVKNLGSTPLVLDRITLNGSNVICEWNILIGSATTTPTGTLITGGNLNETFSAKSADAIAYDDETAVADGTIIDRIWTPITNSIQHDLSGIILGQDHYVQINQITESTSGSVVLVGHFELPS